VSEVPIEVAGFACEVADLMKHFDSDDEKKPYVVEVTIAWEDVSWVVADRDGTGYWTVRRDVEREEA
jgi:hypothetical protein